MQTLAPIRYELEGRESLSLALCTLFWCLRLGTSHADPDALSHAELYANADPNSNPLSDSDSYADPVSHADANTHPDTDA